MRTVAPPIQGQRRRLGRAALSRRAEGVSASVDAPAVGSAGTAGPMAGRPRTGIITVALQSGHAVSWPPYSASACISLPQAPQGKRTIAASVSDSGMDAVGSVGAPEG